MSTEVAYLDASAIVALARGEPTGKRLQEYMQKSVTPVRATDVSFHVGLGMLKGRIPPANGERSYNRFWALLMCLKHNWIEIVETPLADLGQPAGVEHGMDLVDALQLSSIRRAGVGQPGHETHVFITASDGVAAAARQQGFTVWNCRATREPG